MPLLGQAAVPDGMRVYAIGDVHGRFDLVQSLHAAIRNDLERKPPQDYRIIHCGDYIDRGPQSAEVVAFLVELRAREPNLVCLGGNHEDELTMFLFDPVAGADVWLRYGGLQTLASYGIDTSGLIAEPEALQALGEAFAAALPADHLAFFNSLADDVTLGDYYFVHAGIRPGVPFERQTQHDKRWIREPFLSSQLDHGKVVVHGHTPVAKPEVLRNRINIDTQAFATGRLTALVLDGTRQRFLQTAGEASG